MTAPAVAKPLPPGQKRQRLVVLGTGWSAVALLSSIDTNRFDVYCVSPR